MSRTLFLFILVLGAAGAAHAGPGHDHGHAHGKDDHGHAHGGDEGDHGHAHGPAQVLGAVMPPYLRLHAALAKDDLAAAGKAAPALVKAARTHHLDEVAKEAERIPGATLEVARTAFKSLSGKVAETVLALPAARAAYRVFDCAKAPGRWVQREKAARNPFAGGDLRSCGTAVEPAGAEKKEKSTDHGHDHDHDHDHGHEH